MDTPESILGIEPSVGRLVTYPQLRALPEAPWLVEKVIPATGVGWLYGPSYTGKTYVAIDLALRITNGMEQWFGFPVNESGPVVYVLMEGLFDYSVRIEAWLRGHPNATADDLWILPEESVDLVDKESVKRLAKELNAVQPKLVIVDTQALATPGTDENSNTEMGTMLSYMKQLTKLLQAPILLVHHTGKDTERGGRGASAMFAGMDFVLAITNEREMKAEKVKGYKPSPKLRFTLRDFEHDSPPSEGAYADAEIGRDGRGVRGPSQRILDLLVEHPGEYTKTQVMEVLGDTKTLRGAWESLIDADEIMSRKVDRIENGKSKSREVWYELEIELVDGAPEWDQYDEEPWRTRPEDEL